MVQVAETGAVGWVPELQRAGGELGEGGEGGADVVVRDSFVEQDEDEVGGGCSVVDGAGGDDGDLRFVNGSLNVAEYEKAVSGVVEVAVAAAAVATSFRGAEEVAGVVLSEAAGDDVGAAHELRADVASQNWAPEVVGVFWVDGVVVVGELGFPCAVLPDVQLSVALFESAPVGVVGLRL